MSWPDGAGKCQPSPQTLALIDASDKARDAVIEALEPFAKLAEFVNEKHRDSRPFIFAFDTAIAQRLTVGDLRRAKAALSLSRPEGK